MRKYLKYLSFVFVFLLVLTGCDTDAKSEKKLKDAIDKTAKASSLNEKIKLSGSGNVEGQKQDYTIEGDFDTYKDSENSSTMRGKLKLASTGMEYSVESYLALSDTKFGAYVNFNNTWVKFEQEFDKKTYQEVINDLKKEFTDSEKFIKLVKSLKEEKTDKKGYTKLVVTFDKDKINEEMKKSADKAIDEYKNDNTTSAEEKTEAIERVKKISDNGLLSNNIKVNIYIKDGYISIVEVDLSELINCLSKDSLSEEEKKQIDDLKLEAKLSIELSNFNKIEKIEIPADAKNGKDILDFIGSMFSDFGSEDLETNLDF